MDVSEDSMPIKDERRIRFDLAALKDVLKYSQFGALSIGLPSHLPSDIVLDASVGTATFDYVGTRVTVATDKLGALLISYCIRSGIRVPRQGKRTVTIADKAITLVFLEDYLTTPTPKPDQVKSKVGSDAHQYPR
jgi:hypothetical protein